MLLYLYCCAVTVLLYLQVLSVLQSCRITLAGQCDDRLCCCCLVESSVWASIRVLVDQRHDVRKCDEIMNSRRNELSVFIRITFSTYLVYQYKQYSSTNARNDGDFRVERDTFLSEYLWHNDCSAIPVSYTHLTLPTIYSV